MSTYYGFEASAFLLTAPWLSLDALYGIKKNVFTVDTSIGGWWFPGYRNAPEPLGSHFHSTVNPKVGIKFRKVWLKAGPSVHLYKDYRHSGKEPLGIVNMGKIGNMYYNFEILIKI